MSDAIWLFTALPTWYLGAAMMPFSGGVLTLVPAIGLFALAIGIVLGAIVRRRALLWFLAPFAASELLVALAGLMRGQVRAVGSSTPLSLGLNLFLGAQILAAGYLIYRIKGARTPAVAFSVFGITYAATAAFVAGMSFSDNWL